MENFRVLKKPFYGKQKNMFMNTNPIIAQDVLPAALNPILDLQEDFCTGNLSAPSVPSVV
jgi:hypothetical protein